MKVLIIPIFAASLMLPSIAFSAAAKCADFSVQSEAQDYFKSKGKGWKRLDGDKDGEACECLKGGSGYKKSQCTRWRKKNKKS